MKIFSAAWLLAFSVLTTAVVAPLVPVIARAAPAPTIPGTPAGEVFSAWLAAANSGDAGQVQAFKDRYHHKTPVQDILARREQSGGYELLRVEKSSERSLSALLKEKDSDQEFVLDLSVSAADPPAIESMQPRAVPILPPEFAPARMTQSAALAALQARADELAMQGRFSGALLIARHGKILLEKTWLLDGR
jgi:D-alanyl-D-alanine carboxypeptidase